VGSAAAAAAILFAVSTTVPSAVSCRQSSQAHITGMAHMAYYNLVLTVAGVQPAEVGAKGASYVAGGSRADSSGVFMDGINDESPRDAGSQISPPLDSLQEFKIETSGYTAQYGRLSGSVVNMVTRSGANRFHGSLFDFIRNDLFDAEPFDFNPPPAPAKTKLRQNQFGGDFAGPITIPHLYNGHDVPFLPSVWRASAR
jgi:hypothetical protein